LRQRYKKAGQEHKRKLLDQAQELLGYHRKSAIRALRSTPVASGPRIITGRPVSYEPGLLLPVLRKIWVATDYACGVRLQAMMPEWIPAFEAHEKSLKSEVRDKLLSASGRTLDRLLRPLRVRPGRSLTRPGTLLRHQIPIRGSFEEGKAGWLEVDTVALCGGSVAGEFVWMVDAVDYATTWVEVRGMWGRGQEGTLAALEDLEGSLPFALLGLDSDNGGEFINHHVNWTHVRQNFGYERHDNPEVVEPINTLAKGVYGQLLNYFHVSLKLESKERQEGRIKRQYGRPQTPLARVLSSPEVTEATKQRLREAKARLNPFALKLEVARQLKEIAGRRGARE
jgi:hypothetical protein